MLKTRSSGQYKIVFALLLVGCCLLAVLAQSPAEDDNVCITQRYRSGSSRFKAQARELAAKFPRETVKESLLRRHPGMSFADQPELTTGMETHFYVDRNGGEKRVKVPAILKIIGTHCLIYLEKGRRVDEAKLKRMAQIFDKKVYPKTTATFGSEWKPGIDDDPRITLLLLSGMEDCDGYFYPADEYTEENYPQSNQREMLYLSINRLKDIEDFMEHLVAHEFQHMIHWFHDDNESYWVEEGLSEYAATLFNRVPWTAEQFFTRPDRNLLDWEDNQDAENYGHSFLFTDYLLNRPELSESAKIRLVREMVKNKASGIKGLNSALAKVSKKLDFEKIFRDFCVATHLYDCAGGRQIYSFSPLIKRALKKHPQNIVEPRKRFAGMQGTAKGKVSMWSSCAYEFAMAQTPQRLQLQFSGQTVTSARNSFWIALILTDRARKLTPEVRWLRASANSLKTAVSIPASNYDRLLLLICNQGPAGYKDGDGRIPKAEFGFSLGLAKFSELHRDVDIAPTSPSSAR
jgi:hypothetical protein